MVNKFNLIGALVSLVIAYLFLRDYKAEGKSGVTWRKYGEPLIILAALGAFIFFIASKNPKQTKMWSRF